MPARVFAAIEAVALAAWTGALAGFAFVSAPTAFRELRGRPEFATLVGATIRGLTVYGYACAAVALVAIGLRAATLRRRAPEIARVVLILGMLAGAVYEARTVVPRMESSLQGLGGSIDALAPSDPRRVRFDDEHRDSSMVYGLVLLLGVAAIAIGAARPPEGERASPGRRATDRD